MGMVSLLAIPGLVVKVTVPLFSPRNSQPRPRPAPRLGGSFPGHVTAITLEDTGHDALVFRSQAMLAPSPITIH